MGVNTLSTITRWIPDYIKISACFAIIAALTAGSLPAAESIPSSQTTTEEKLSQHIKQLIQQLEYPDAVAEDFVKMINGWQDNQATPILAAWKQTLDQANNNFTQGKISRKQLAEKQCCIAEKLADRIRKEITVNNNFFDLADIIKHKQTQCLGYSQLVYILGTSVGLSIRPINVLELQTPGPLPSGCGHIGCIVDLDNGRTIMLNLAPGGFISYPFVLEQEFTKTGNYWQLKDKTNPLNIYRKIQLLNREGLIAYICTNRAANYTASGRLDKAASCYDRAISLNPDFAEAWNNRAASLAKSGRLEQVLSDYDRAVSLNPDFAEAWSNRASACIKLNRFEEAISDCNRAIECNPRLAAAWNNRANAYAKTGQLDKAVSYYNHAIRLDSKLVEAYYNRATILGISGRYEQAISDFNRAAKLNPNLPQVYYNRANAYAKLKQFNKAIADYSRAIELKPDFEKALSSRETTYALLK